MINSGIVTNAYLGHITHFAGIWYDDLTLAGSSRLHAHPGQGALLPLGLYVLPSLRHSLLGVGSLPALRAFN